MFNSPKLFVMYKKFFKLINSLDVFSSPQKVYFLKFSCKDKSSKHVDKKVCPPSLGFYNLPNQILPKEIAKKYCWPRKSNETPKPSSPSFCDKIFNVVWKYFNIVPADIDSNAKLNNIRKIDFTEIYKNVKKDKNEWVSTSIHNNLQMFSKPFHNGRDENSTTKLKDFKKVLECEGATRNKIESEKSNKQKEGKKEVNISSSKKLADELNGVADQRLYTQLDLNKSKSHSLKPLKDPKPHESNKKDSDVFEIPPPRRCRLSCPLPPPEYNPPEWTEFIHSRHRSSLLYPHPVESISPKKSEKNSQESNSWKKVNKIANEWKLIEKNSPNNLSKISNKQKIYPSNFPSNKPKFNENVPNDTPKMKALLFEPNGLGLNYFAVDAPTQIHKDEVLVQVAYSGVCDTDLFITEGKVSSKNTPLILGQEISGKVYAVGSQITHVKVGDNVAVNPYTACNVCWYCTRGLFTNCLNEGTNNSIGISKDGGWAEYVVVKKPQVYKIPDKLGLDQAALIQPLSCVLSGMLKLNLSSDLDILIQGLNVNSYLWASVLHSKGFKRVFVSDKAEKKKTGLDTLNLNYAFVPTEEIQNYRADVVIECTGSPPGIEKSLKILNPNGQMCFFGEHNPKADFRCNPYEIAKKGITIVGNNGNAFCFSKAVDLASTMKYRYLDYDKLGIRVFNLQEFQKAFHMKRSGEIGKIMFKFES